MSGANKPMRRPAAGRPRLGARVAAVQALFQSELAGEASETVIQQFVRHRLGELPGQGGFEEGRVPQADVPLFVNIVRQVAQNAETLDPIVAGNLSGTWTMDRLDPMQRSLLRAAAAELWGGKEPPAKVVIN